MTNKSRLSEIFSSRVKRPAKKTLPKGGHFSWLAGAMIALSVVVIGQLPDHIRTAAASRGRPFFNFQDMRQMPVTFRGAQSETGALQSAQAAARALATSDLDGNGTPDVIAGYANGATGIVTIQRGNPDAYAPTDEAVFARLVRGYNPEPLLPDVETYPVPEPVDFLVVGNFGHHSAKDILIAAKGGRLYLLARDPKGGFGVPKPIALPGLVTALASGEFRAADGFADVAVGVTEQGGDSLLLFDGVEGFSEPLAQYRLDKGASAIEFGGLDDDPFLDVAVAAGREVLVVHGWGRKESVASASRVERINFGSSLRGLAVGEFIWDREGRSEMAALTDDAVVQIVQNEKLDTRPFNESEKAERTRGRIKINSTNRAVDIESVPSWQPGRSAGWTKANRFAASSVGSASFKALLRTHLSRREMDDLMVIGGDQSRLEILYPVGPNDRAADDALSIENDLVRVTLDVGSEPLAVLPLPQKLNGVMELVVLSAGKAAPKIIPNAPTATITVDRTDDPSGAALTAASACTGAANDCSLRGAFNFANTPANSGTTIMLAAGTYILSINGSTVAGCDGNATGDLGANQTTTLTGAGAATTIIRQTGTGPSNDGDRIMCMNEPFTIGLVYNYSGITFVGGRDGTEAGTGTVLGGAGIIGGELNNSLTLTNVVFANNQETVAGSANLGGGGIQITGGNLTITNSTFGGSSAPGAYTDRSNTTTGNKQTGSGGGITYTPSSPAHSGGSGILTITGSTFSRNTSAGIGGGGADLLIFAFAAPGGIGSGSATISTSTFSNNQAANGAGIIVESLPTTVATTNITNNSAGNRGGGIYVGGGSLLLNGASPSVTFSGNTATNAGSSISTAAPVNVDGTNTTIGGDIEISTGGVWTNNTGSTLAPTNVVLTGGTLNMNNSTMNVSGNLTIGPAAVVGSTFNGNTGTVNIQGNFVFSAGGAPATTLNAGTGTFNFNGTSAQSITNGTSITFSNLTDSNVNQPLTFNNSLAVNGNLTANGANARLAPLAGTVISGTGTLTGTGTARVTRTAATADFLSQYTITNKTLTNLTVDYIGASAQVLSAFTYGPLRITNAAGVNSAGIATVNGLLTLMTGALGVGTTTLNINNGTSVGAGSLTSSVTGTVNYGQSSNGQNVLAANYGNLTFSNFTKTLPNGGTVQIRGTFTTGAAGGHTLTGSTVEFNGTSAQALPSNFTTYNNLTLNNAAGVTGFAGLIVQNLLRVQAGTFTSSSTYKDVQIDPGAVLAGVAATTINITGNWTNNGTFNANGNTVNFNGSAAQSIGGSSATTFNNLTINNGAGVNLLNNATVGSALTLTSGSLGVGTTTLTLNGAATATGGSLTSGATGTVNYNQSSNGQVVLAANYGNLTCSNFNKTLPASGTVGIAGIFTPGTAPAHTITGSTINFNGGGSQTIPVFTYNNLTSSNSGARTLASSGIIRIASAFTPGTNAYTITGSTLEYNGTAAQTLPAGFTPYNNLTLNNAAGVTGFAGLTVQGLLRVQAGTFTSSSTYKDVQIDPGATLAAAAGSTINVSGNWTNNGTFTPNDGTVNFNGSSVQSLGGSSTTAFNNLTINNASGVTLNANITINATLTLTAGALAIGSRTLTLNNGITITGGSFTSAANGTVNYNQSSNGQNIAPGNYGNLTFSDFTKTLPSSGSVRIAGTFTVGAAGGHTITGSTVEYNGAVAQAIPSGFTSYNNLTLNNAAGVTGFSGLIVQGLLRIQQGTFTSSSNYNSVQIDNGATLSATPASTINIAGNWTNNGTFNANTGTVVFNGSSAQTIGGVTTFNNLTINNASGVTLGGSTNVTVSAALTLTSGAFGIGTNTLTLNGGASAAAGTLTSGVTGTVNYNQSSNGQAVLSANYGNLTFSNFTKTLPSGGVVRIAGTFTTGAAGGHTVTGSTIEFNGAAGQSLPAGFNTYDNLTVNNAAGISLGGNVAVNGALTFTNGNITTNASVLTVGTAGTTNRTIGHVLGNLKKLFSGVGSFTYHVGTANGYSPVAISVTAGTGDLTVLAVQGPQPVLTAAKSLQRYWTLAGTGITVNITFTYLDPTDIPGTSNEAAYRPIRVSGGSAFIFFDTPPTSFVDEATNTINLQNIAGFSDWTAGEATAPTAVEDVALEAAGYDGGVSLEWKTGSEINNLGFNIYREEDGKRTLVNSQIVAGSALLAGSGIRLGAGRSYGWWDPGATIRAQYWIEDIDLNGSRTLHGPVTVKHAVGGPSRKSSAAMLSQVGVSHTGISRPVPVTAAFSVVGPDRVNIMNSLAGQKAVKLAVKHDGYYRVPSAGLVAAGIDPNADPEKLQLFAEGNEIPINVLTDSQGLISSVEFYGIGLDTAATDARVYWLISGSEAGLRIPQLKGSGFASDATSFLYAIERKDRTVYFAGLRNGERENFFGPVIAAEPVDQTLLLPNVDVAATGQATVDVALQGVTTAQHRVWIYVNGTLAGELLFDGQSQGQARLTLTQSQLIEGNNVIRFVAQGGPGDVTLVDYTRISYWHRFVADDNALRLTVNGGEQTIVSGFTNSAIRVFDVTNADSVEEIISKVAPDNDGFSATFASPRAGQRALLAIADERADGPAGISANRPSSLRSPNHAGTLVIITRGDFLPAFETLAKLRRNKGIKTELVDVEDIYDEFSFGNKTPEAVKAFLQYATGTWKIGPKFVLLGADSSFDPRNHLGLGDWDIAPSKLIDTGLMETASDDWFVDFNDDGLPELAVGRLPARSLEEASAMVAKISNYEGSTGSEEMLLVSDLSDTFDFAGANAELRGLIPPNLRVNEIDRGRIDTATARDRLLEAINRGQKVVNYTGHGSVTLWRAGLLTSEDARLMENMAQPSLFILMTCLNGYGYDPVLDSLAESLIKAEGGAIAVWSSSGMTDPEQQAALNRGLYSLLFAKNAGQMTIGEMVVRAKGTITSSDIRRSWILIGDPTMKIR